MACRLDNRGSCELLRVPSIEQPRRFLSRKQLHFERRRCRWKNLYRRSRTRHAFTPHYDSMSQCSINIIVDVAARIRASVGMPALCWYHGPNRVICVHASLQLDAIILPACAPSHRSFSGQASILALGAQLVERSTHATQIQPCDFTRTSIKTARLTPIRLGLNRTSGVLVLTLTTKAVR